ncbi:MAG: hypothetical protein MR488_10355 [Lachnospiraceae bacterium]|nr:hypothetical protein [Lachnospiraceae bacterium]
MKATRYATYEHMRTPTTAFLMGGDDIERFLRTGFEKYRINPGYIKTDFEGVTDFDGVNASNTIRTDDIGTYCIVFWTQL